MSEYLATRQRCTERLLAAINEDPWLARYAVAQVCLFMELGSLNELVELVELADKQAVEADRNYFEKLVRERFGF
jgi:hypothetical protein